MPSVLRYHPHYRLPTYILSTSIHILHTVIHLAEPVFRSYIIPIPTHLTVYVPINQLTTKSTLKQTQTQTQTNRIAGIKSFERKADVCSPAPAPPSRPCLCLCPTPRYPRNCHSRPASQCEGRKGEERRHLETRNRTQMTRSSDH